MSEKPDNFGLFMIFVVVFLIGVLAGAPLWIYGTASDHCSALGHEGHTWDKGDRRRIVCVDYVEAK